MYIPRRQSDLLLKQAGNFPVLSISGPRQSGKTTLLKTIFPGYQYFNLERLDLREIIRLDPLGFLESNGDKIIFDEVQNLPELFHYLQVVADERKKAGQFILSGSQSFVLNEKIAQSLAGRVFISTLLPFDLGELTATNADVYQTILNGFYPRLFEFGISPEDFYPSYLSTYVERDIRSMKSIENLSSFIHFLGLCAGRIGQVLNLSSLANDAGISVNTAKSWISLLEASFILFQLQPYSKNFSKRLIKSPKLYFFDTGLACSILRITSKEMLQTHYLYGSLFENLVIADLLKTQLHQGKRPSIYYWRESNGTEIDCIIEHGNNEITAIEIKGGATFTKDYLKNLNRFPDSDLKINKKLIYANTENLTISGVEVSSWRDIGCKL